MSTRNRRAAEAAAEAANLKTTHGALRRLQFDEPLSWRAGKPIAISELLRRLSALSKELREMEQEENDRDSFTHVAKELTGHGLLAHKDKGVRAWTACCLVDILRLCAPDAPYTGAQLRDIFTLIITSILPALSDPSNAYNSQHTYVLQSLAQVKSIVLLTDIPGSETLILQLFTSFFDILSGSSKTSTGEQIGKNVEYHMTAVLVILVDEAAHLPLTIVDTILAQFLRADPRVLTGGAPKGKRTGAAPNMDEKQSTLLLKELPPAYNMAKTICNSCPEKMARYVSQYFNDVIVDASASVANGAAKSHSHRRIRDDSDDEEAHHAPTEEDLKELQKAHRLLRELWRASPAVLQNVIPQLEAELSAENVQLRLLATETLGDMISGIGAAGPPPPPSMDPTVYPPQTLDGTREPHPNASLLTTPSSPQPFPQVHPAAYHSFLSRKHDKSAVIRAAWATAIGRILSTSAGGIGLNPNDERTLLKDFAVTLVDADERVRVAAVTAIGLFSFPEVVLKLGSVGGVEKEGSVLCNLAGRARDRKHAVRVEGMMTLGRIWGVAAGEIAAGNGTVISALGAIPSKLFDTFYVNDLDINALLDHVLFQLLLPLDYPPSKSKSKTNGTTSSQPTQQGSQNGGKETTDWDRIRTERMLHLVKSLDAKAKKAFFAVQGRQVQLSSLMQAFLKRCEEYNGGVMEENEAETRGYLNRLIDYFAQMLPDSSKVTVDLWKFVKAHDRRNYQLVRFCMDPSSDYRTVVKAIKELRKRILVQPGSSSASILDSLMPLLYRASLLVYNKSHISSILDLSRSEDHTLGSTAQEVLKEISTRHPEVFKAHVNELCRLLQDQSPTEDKSNEPGALDALKACAAFARRYPKEMPHDRKFLQSITNYALYGTPPLAAKYAVVIILATSERKEMHARDLIQQCTRGFEYGARHFLPRLAALSQLVLLAPNEAEEEADAVLDIALKEVLLKVRNPSQADKPDWFSDDELDEECKAKVWALRILVNRVRSHPDPKTLSEAAQPVYQLLNTLIAQHGESSKTKDTPATHRSRFRLAASLLFLKLCTSKAHDELLLPRDFDRLACTAQDSLSQVRSTFMRKLKKYLGQGRLSPRFYSIVFLQAFEPQLDLREDTMTWIRSRAKNLASKKSTVMESLFARLLSLLAHHPDFDTTVGNLEDFARYILFYLRSVATEENLSLVYYVAQRVKQAKDAVIPERSENLYILSDLAQAVIRRYEDVQGWSMQAWPGKMGLPASLFRALPDHEVAQEIATRSFLPEELGEKLDVLVRAKPKMKRKSDHQDGGPTPPKKKTKSAVGASTTTTSGRSSKAAAKSRNKSFKPRTPKPAKRSAEDVLPSSERRRSGRTASVKKVVTYAEDSDTDEDDQPDEEDEEDEAMSDDQNGVATGEDENEEEEGETGDEHQQRNANSDGSASTSHSPSPARKVKATTTTSTAKTRAKSTAATTAKRNAQSKKTKPKAATASLAMRTRRGRTNGVDSDGDETMQDDDDTEDGSEDEADEEDVPKRNARTKTKAKVKTSVKTNSKGTTTRTRSKLNGNADANRRTNNDDSDVRMSDAQEEQIEGNRDTNMDDAEDEEEDRDGDVGNDSEGESSGLSDPPDSDEEN